MKTKISEVIVKTKDFKKMRDQFLAEKLVRKWNEDFVDDDTGEVVSVERSELILEKGTKLDDTAMSLINFHFQTGEFKTVQISNQRRSGELTKRMPSVWQVSAYFGDKKYNVFLYSNSSDNTKLIAEDYLEQLASGLFSIVMIKEVEDSTLIPEDFGYEEREDDQEFVDLEEDYYKMEVLVADEDFERNQKFIVKGNDAEEAKEKIIKYLHVEKKKQAPEAEDYQFEVTILTAKTIPCDYVIDYEFSLDYLKSKDE